MPLAEYQQSSFLGGEWSKTAQGRFDKPEYKTAMNLCLNGLLLQQGAWTRRPGFNLGGASNAGLPARVIEYAFAQNMPYTLEFTDGNLRFWAGSSLATTNETHTVTAFGSGSNAGTTSVDFGGTRPTWAAGTTVVLNNLNIANAALVNRQFTVLLDSSSNKLDLVDAMTGTGVPYSSVGAIVGSPTISRVQVLATPYVAGAWGSLQAIQGDGDSILLHGSFMPQVLTPTVVVGQYATFGLTPATFVDGPYLNFVSNGAVVTPSATSGLINLTLAFTAYSSTTAYSAGDFVTSSSVCYQSLSDQNSGNTPASSASFWKPVFAGLAIGPNGFLQTDIGRHIRLSSEPALWASGTTYSAGQSVTYGAQTYWTSLTANNVGHVPGVDAVNWAINPKASIWTWGKITGLLNFIPGGVSGVVQIGNMVQNSQLGNAFNGVTDQNYANSAFESATYEIAPQQDFNVTLAAGQDYGATVATAYTISSATITGSTDFGIGILSLPAGVQATGSFSAQLTLWGSNSAPSTYTDGVLLGTASLVTGTGTFKSNVGLGVAPITITSNDQINAYRYVWITYQIGTSIDTTGGPGGNIGYSGAVLAGIAAQIQFNAVPETGTGGGCSAEILGPPLLNTSAVRTWRLGVYGGVAGWPTCGTYHEGRLWIGGAVNNRFDASQPNQMWGDQISFAPTNYDGSVDDSSAINYTLNAPSTNTILGFKPDLQGIVILTEKGEWLVQATTLNAPLTALNIQAHQVTRMGSSITPTAVPVQTEHTIVFIQRYARKLIEYFSDIFSGKFTAPDLAEEATHLTSTTSPLVELAYQQNLTPTIWARTGTGQLLGCAYKRDTLMSSQGPTSKGWHQHILGSGRSITSMTIGPSPDGTLDTLAVVTAPTVVSDSYHICFMNKIFEETDALVNASFLDEAIQPSYYQSVVLGGVSSLQLFGLWHLNGMTCDVFAGGLDCGKWAVSNGQLTIPLQGPNWPNPLLTSAFISSFSGAMPIVVGFAYTSQGQVLRPVAPQEAGTRIGPALGKTKRSNIVSVGLVNTQGISFGTNFTDTIGGTTSMNAARLTTRNGKGTQVIAANQMFTGTLWQPLTDEYSLDSMLCWQITRPFPATVTSVGASISAQDQ